MMITHAGGGARCARYNQRVRWAGIAVILTALLAVGCGGGANTAEAVRQAILDHLASRPDLDLKGIQVDVASVSFRADEAEALVSFRPRSGPGDAFQMRYTLERKGGRWVVKSKSQAGGMPHGATGGLPPGHPDIGGSAEKEKKGAATK